MMKRSLAAVLCVLVCLLALPSAALAAIDMDAPTRLTISAAYDGAGLRGVELSLWQLASMDKNGTFTPLAPFDRCGEDFNRLQGSEWDAVVPRLAELSVSATPSAAVQTDASGHAVLTKLPKGLYLVQAPMLEAGEWVYAFSPMVVSVPGKAADSDRWQYSVTAEVKLERLPSLMDLRIVKIWKDTGAEKHRPEYILADLYCDELLLHTVELSLANNWQYLFEELERPHAWKVVERKVPDGYTASYAWDNGAMVITNTYDTPPKPTEPPKIPQTGLLWWPVPLLAGLGVAVFLVGWAIHRKWRIDHEGS